MKALSMVAAVVAALVLLSSPASANDVVASQYRSNFDRDVCTAMDMAARFLVESSLPAGSQGGPAWHWQLGTGPRADNVAGLAALALLEAYRVSGNSAYLTVARRHGDSLVRASTGWSKNNLPYKADLELLAQLQLQTGNAAYGRIARRGMEKLLARSPDGADEVSRIWQGRRASAPALLGFDVALAIRAALANGYRGYAYQLADAVLARLPEWYRPNRDRRYSLVSAGSLAEALRRLDAGHYRRAGDRFRADLLRYQQNNGSWLANETQPSAYALMALAVGTPRERAAFRRGIEWLKSTMLKRGDFALYNDYMPEPFVGRIISEVNAEALQALSLACRLR